MNKKFIAATVILGLIILFVAGFYVIPVFIDKAFEKAMNSMHKKQIVAENVQITNEWTEITSEKPLEPTKLVQEVQLLIKGYKSDIGKPDFGNITLTDGTKIKPEVEIVDENGKSYQLKDGHRVDNFVGFSVDDKIHGSSEFPKNVSYKIILIRSDKPFLRKIIWYDYDMK